MKSYFMNIWQASATIFEGMAVTFSHLLQKPVTVQYPDRMEKRVQDTLPDGYRGRLDVDIEICTACGACMRACPINVIDLKGARTERKKGLTLLYFNIHHGKCMYCNLCVEACPVNVEGMTAIRFKKEFEGSSQVFSDLLESFIDKDESLQRKKEADETASKKSETDKTSTE